MTNKPHPSKEEILRIFRYDETSPTKLTRIVKTGVNTVVGEPAGYQAKATGRFIVSVNKVQYLLHRVVWIMHYGDIPDGMTIDHINNNPSDNRISNLRLASYTQNNWNTKKRANNKAGFKGVAYDKSRGNFIATIRDGQRKIKLGVFGTAKEAYSAYVAAAKTIHGEFANVG